MRVNKPTNNIQLPKHKPTVHNVFILDSSASMYGGKYDNAVEGINVEIKTLKDQTEINYTQSLVEFAESSNIRKQIWFQDIKEVNAFQGKNFYQNTALNDAIGFTINEVYKSMKEGDKVLLKIFTDGQENASKKYSSSTVQKLIKEAETRGFTITFEGTQSDTQFAIRNYGISQSNTHVHDNTARGVKMSAETRVAATVAYSKSLLAGEDVTLNFYTKSIEK